MTISELTELMKLLNPAAYFSGVIPPWVLAIAHTSVLLCFILPLLGKALYLFVKALCQIAIVLADIYIEISKKFKTDNS